MPMNIPKFDYLKNISTELPMEGHLRYRTMTDAFHRLSHEEQQKLFEKLLKEYLVQEHVTKQLHRLLSGAD